MKSIISWFNDRTGLVDWCGHLADSPLAGRPCWCKVLPCTILFACCVQAITGFFLWVFYSPSAQTAWESVYYVQHEVAGGWILRATHHYSAHVLLALLIFAVVKSILSGEYRAPRELVFWATVGLGLCALAAVLTGDLLSWDQNGYASTKTRTGFLAFIPLIGDSLLKIAIGGPGPALGHGAVTRFFALHVGVFGAGFIVLLLIRGILAHRAAAAAAVAGNATHYWPAQAWRGTVACLVVLGIVALLVCQHGITLPHAGATLLSPADTDPANGYNAARPEWFLVGVYEFSHMFPGELAIIPIFIVPGMLVCIALLMPFLAYSKIGHAFNVLFTIALLVALVGLSYHSLAKDRDNPEHQKAIALEKRQADRVCELISCRGGIPPTGALTLLKTDPKTQGPRLFVQNCASCHDHATGKDEIADIKATDSSAPNLAEFASREWIAGLMDPKKIVSPQYFGKTKFKTGKMARWVKETLKDLDADQKKALNKLVIALSAEAQLPSQREMDKRDAALIKEGQKLIVDMGCTDCHRYRDKGPKTSDLTGYGSAEWTAGIICNPAKKRFYWILNDRMPAYAASSDPAQNTLNPEQIKMLTDWIRGDWERAASEQGD
jgi:ubiquinol-cytochrome c reductase cytochrome b subunit